MEAVLVHTWVPKNMLFTTRFTVFLHSERLLTEESLGHQIDEAVSAVSAGMLFNFFHNGKRVSTTGSRQEAIVIDIQESTGW
jgi:hypothetical protein